MSHIHWKMDDYNGMNRICLMRTMRTALIHRTTASIQHIHSEGWGGVNLHNLYAPAITYRPEKVVPMLWHIVLPNFGSERFPFLLSIFFCASLFLLRCIEFSTSQTIKFWLLSCEKTWSQVPWHCWFFCCVVWKETLLASKRKVYLQRKTFSVCCRAKSLAVVTAYMMK